MTRRVNVFDSVKAHDSEYFAPRPCDVPTDALPGSDAKLAELLRRAEDGVELWHSKDRRYRDDGRCEFLGYPPRPLIIQEPEEDVENLG